MSDAQIFDTNALNNIQGGVFKDARTNIREVKGTLAEWGAFQSEKFANSMSAKLQLTNIEVIDSETPISANEFPVFIPISDKKNTRWFYFITSLGNFIDTPTRLNDAVGKRLHLKMVEHNIYNGEQKKQLPTGVWEVVGVEGAGSTKTVEDPGDRAMELIIGKTSPEFKACAMTDAIIGKDAALRGQIISGAWQKMMVESGSITVDENGRYQFA